MKRKRTYLIINPRVGKNIAQLRDVMAVFSAAEWKTRVALAEYDGHATILAARAADAGYDLILAYGGDGTLNQVLSGVVTVTGRPRTVGVIPGGTANVWAGEVGVPTDPVKAALSLINSEGRSVDVGHVEVESFTLLPGPPAAGEPLPTGPTGDKGGRKPRGREQAVRPTRGSRHHFLLMAGLGLDAAIMGRVSARLSRKVGAGAVAIAAAEEMPSSRTFPIEIRGSAGGKNTTPLWRGDALQVVVGNTRGYGNIAEMTPAAHIDDGVLDVCVITAGTLLTKLEQIVSLLLRRRPSRASSKRFRGAHLWISVPASIGMQLDGSAIESLDRLREAELDSMQLEGGAGRTMVTYRFDAMPRAARVAIPSGYDDALFENGPDEPKPVAREQKGADGERHLRVAPGNTPRPGSGGTQPAALPKTGRKVTVIGASPIHGRKGTYVIAGSTPRGNTGEMEPVAVRIGADTTLVSGLGGRLARAAVAGLAEGNEIMVVGSRNRRGVIRAKRVVLG